MMVQSDIGALAKIDMALRLSSPNLLHVLPCLLSYLAHTRHYHQHATPHSPGVFPIDLATQILPHISRA